MKHGIYAFYDKKAESFVGLGLMVIATSAVACRNFTAAVQKPGNPISDAPEDHDLIFLGEYDLMNNKIIPAVSDPVSNPVITGKQVLAELGSLPKED